MFENFIATNSATMAAELIASSSAQSNALMTTLENFATLHPTFFAVLFILMQIWVIAWKGLALWKAGRLNQKLWFILVLLVNTFGIFEIIYYFYLSKQDWEKIGQKLHLNK